MSFSWTYNFILLVCLIWFVQALWKRRKLYILSWKVQGPFALPILGNALKFLCKDDDIFERAVDLIGGFPKTQPIRLWFGPKLTLIFTNVSQVEKIMTSTKLINKDDIYKFIKVFNGEGLIQSSGARWKRDRKLMAPIFQAKHVNCFFDHVLNHALKLVDVLKFEVDKSKFNVEKYLHRCSADIVNETILGFKTNAQEGTLDKLLHTISRMYVIAHARIIKIWLQTELLYKHTHYYKEQEEGIVYIRKFFDNVLIHAQNNYEHEKNKECRSLLNRLLEIRETYRDFATDPEIIHHLQTIYTASEDTITVICSFTLVLLGMYPNVQNKAIEEIFDVLGKNKDKKVEFEDLPKLKYLEMIIKDVLRLFPIAPFIMRSSYEDLEIDKYKIPAGCSVIVSIHNIHRDIEHWEKPNEFYPEHFLPEAVEKRCPYAFMPFSAGPRMCLGKTYAYNAIKIILVTILQNYIIEADGKLSDKKLKTDITVRFKDDCYPIRIKHREYQLVLLDTTSQLNCPYIF